MKPWSANTWSIPTWTAPRGPPPASTSAVSSGSGSSSSAPSCAASHRALDAAARRTVRRMTSTIRTSVTTTNRENTMAKDVTVASGLIGAEATGHSAGPLFMRVTPAVHTVAMLQMDVDRHAGILRAGGGRSRSTSDSHGGSRSRREEIACGQAWSHPWRPLAGPALLERLRVTRRPRPKVDPEFVFRLRCHLDAELATDSAGEGRGDGHGAQGSGSGSGAGVGAGAGAGPGGGEGSGASGPGDTLSRLSPLVVTKDRLTRVLSCEAHYVAAEFGERTP